MMFSFADDTTEIQSTSQGISDERLEALSVDTLTPRTFMRLPSWIESIGKQPSQSIPARPEILAHPERIPNSKPLTRPKPLPEKKSAISQRLRIQPRSVQAPPARLNEDPKALSIEKTPLSTDEGRPGRSLLRSRTAAFFDGFSILTGGWTEESPKNSRSKNDETSLPLNTQQDVSSPPTVLGPEKSVLRRKLGDTSETNPRSVTAQQSPSTNIPSTLPSAKNRKEQSPSAQKSISEQKTPAQTALVDAETKKFGTDGVSRLPPRLAQNKAAVTQPSIDAKESFEEPAVDANKTNEPTPSSIPQAVSTDSKPVSINPPVAAAPDETPTISIDPASFRGVLPGKTTQEELIADWGEGEPFTRDDGSIGLAWVIEPFERIEVMMKDNIVSAIRIALEEPVAISELARQLEIADLRTVSVLNEQGVSIGEVFPERGVVFSVEPGTQLATDIMLEQLDPESFVLRAEGEVEASMAMAVADLQYAIQIDPEHLRAHRLLMVLLSDQGKWNQAHTLATMAERIDPVDTWTSLKAATILLALGKIDEAKIKVESVRSNKTLPPLVEAQTFRLLGKIELASQSPNYQQAVESFSQAIRIAVVLSEHRSAPVRRAAKDVLLDAHLGTALAIASGEWQQKARVLPKWLERSEEFAMDLMEAEEGGTAIEFRLCQGALAVAAVSPDVVDSLTWVKRLLAARGNMDNTLKDPWRLRQIDWEVGTSLENALLANQKRNDTSDMLENCTLTAAYLDRGVEQRELTASERKRVGDLYFRIGILYSLQKGDHPTAVTWFDRTVPLWSEGLTATRGEDLGRIGESLVSMAISYWQIERRDDAIEISKMGVDMMVEAVDRKQLEERSLAVAYGNLSTMHAELGDLEESKTYAEMAGRAESSESSRQ